MNIMDKPTQQPIQTQPQADPGAFLVLKDLRKSFHVGKNDVEVLKGINISLKSGQFIIIFGPSGCGKSTLLHTLLGLEIPTSGQMLIDGNDFYAMTEDERALYRRHRIGIIYQQPLWLSSFNVLENVSFPLRLLGYQGDYPEEKALDRLTQVGLAQWANYTPTELSSGQQQKISLARCLVIDPILVVADEPTGNLDTVSGEQLLQTFVDLVKNGRTVVMVTHDLEYLKYADTIIHMIDGQVVEEYRPKNKTNLEKIEGKKEIHKKGVETNVRDPEFLKKLDL
jgi:ABC-type lipoprotein export system ATPase subunit